MLCTDQWPQHEATRRCQLLDGRSRSKPLTTDGVRPSSHTHIPLPHKGCWVSGGFPGSSRNYVRLGLCRISDELRALGAGVNWGGPGRMRLHRRGTDGLAEGLPVRSSPSEPRKRRMSGIECLLFNGSARSKRPVADEVRRFQPWLSSWMLARLFRIQIMSAIGDLHSVRLHWYPNQRELLERV